MFDITFQIRNDPYRFISRACRDAGRDWISTRVMLEPVVCLTGCEAARFFYDPNLFQRKGAAPAFLKATLFGRHGVQGLDGAAHRHRKAKFLELLGPDRAAEPARRGAAEIARVLSSPRNQPLQGIAERALTKAVCDWAGVPVSEDRLSWLVDRLSDLFEHAVPPGIGHFTARRSRRRADAWAADLVSLTRKGEVDTGPDSALGIVATWTDVDGAPLSPEIAAVELLNVLRPYVAISAYLTFIAWRLAVSPEWRERLASGTDTVGPFVEEVRRTAPFFPLVAARAAVATDWKGCAIPAGRLVLLDIYGTNRDPAVWADPEVFRPERFKGTEPAPFAFIPQGGDGHLEGHRCAGEWITRAVMRETVPVLLEDIDWARLPDQDLDLDMRRLPALPGDRFRLPQFSRRSAQPAKVFSSATTM